MIVDSFKYLPRSFRPLFETPPPSERHPVWAPFAKRLSEATIALLTTGGLYVEGEQEPFDAESEKRNPSWGDPTWRSIPDSSAQGYLGMVHLHVRNDDVLADHDVALPIRRLHELVADGVVGSAAPSHISVMGYQEAGLEVWRTKTGPEIVSLLREQQTDGVVLAPV
jgi:D-proline reductase (dithiol) PrdB